MLNQLRNPAKLLFRSQAQARLGVGGRVPVPMQQCSSKSISISQDSTLSSNQSNQRLISMSSHISHSPFPSCSNSSTGPTDPDTLTLSKTSTFASLESTQSFLDRLSDQHKIVLFNTLNLELLKRKYQDELGVYLTKFGRPTSVHVDPTGTFCEISPRWLEKKLVKAKEIVIPVVVVPPTLLQDEVKGTPPTGKDIWAVGIRNALPFVGFGFLDNLIMILAGDYIDTTIGMGLGISTMAAAALGNTISDVAGIASAWYVEKVAEKIGIHQPSLTAFQLASWQIRWVTNIGRALGVTIGCLLGMIPLFFLNNPTSAATTAAKGEEISAENSSHSEKSTTSTGKDK